MNIIRSISRGRNRGEEYAPTDPAAPVVAPDNSTLDPSDPNWSLAISNFPAKLHPILKEIDDEGNGQLELDELTEVFTMYAELKKASTEGEIAISTLPKAIQPSLRVFDMDGSGSISPLELSRGAELYADSKNQVKRLTRVVIILFMVLCATIGVITGLTVVVVEASKETKTSSSGITTVKGSDTPTATGSVTVSSSIRSAVSMTVTQLQAIKSFKTTTAAGVDLSYTITGYRRDSTSAIFYSARGDTITVQKSGAYTIVDANGVTLATVTAADAKRRRLLFAGGGDEQAGSFSSSAEVFMEDTVAKKFDSCMSACDKVHVSTQNEDGDGLKWLTPKDDFELCEDACAKASGYSDFDEDDDDDADGPEGAPTAAPVAPNGGAPVSPNGGAPVSPNGGAPVAPNGGAPVSPNGGAPVSPIGGAPVLP